MQYGVTVFFYLIVGICVAVSLWLQDESIGGHRAFRALSAPFFWPIYLPVLLTGSRHLSLTRAFDQAGSRDKADEMALLITKVETELDAALGSLNGWTDDLLASEQGRIVELRTAWRQQAEHIRELDRLLAQTSEPMVATGEIQIDIPSGNSASVESKGDLRLELCERTRNENLQKLKQVRRQMHDELTATLAWVRELVTMIYLARFTGAPASRALELVQQIAAAVEGLSAKA